MDCNLLSMSAVKVHDSHPYRDIEKTRECISLIFELSEMFLSFQMVFSFASADVVCAILDNYSYIKSKKLHVFFLFLVLLTHAVFSWLKWYIFLYTITLKYKVTPGWVGFFYTSAVKLLNHEMGHIHVANSMYIYSPSL